MRISFPLCVGIVSVSAILAGCGTAPIARSVISANLAQEEAANQLLVLNIARAHERMPMHFSQIGQLRSGPGGWSLGIPSLSLELPFGGAAEAKYGLTLGADGQTPADVTPQNSQEFMRGMTKMIDPDQVAYFAKQGWPAAMLLHLFVESIDIVNDDGLVTDRLVNNPASEGFNRFEAFVKAASTCDLIADTTTATAYFSTMERNVGLLQGAEAKKANLVIVGVDASGDAVKGKNAQPAGYRLGSVSQAQVIRWVAQPTPLHTPQLQASPAGAPSQPSQAAEDPSPNACKTGPSINESGVFGFNVKASGRQETGERRPLQWAVPSVQTMTFKSVDLQRLLRSQSAPSDTKKANFEVQFVTRSPQGIIYYLGELSRVQNASWPAPFQKPLTIDLPGDQKSKAILFQMKNGPIEAEPAVNVTYGGQTFWVPKYKGSPPKSEIAQDRSVMTLALLTLIIGLQDKGADAPTVNNVRVLR
jgi:hypothetical protein